MRSAPYRRLSLAISLPQGHGFSGDPGCGRLGSGLVFPVELEAQTRPSQERLRLNNEEGLFPGDEAVVERPKPIRCQPRDEAENPLHGSHSPL